MGNKVYAKEMAKLLDPKGVLFKGRVISRGDSGDNVDGDPKIKDLDGVLGMESAVVIIDDSIRVWPHNKLNLIVIERYTVYVIHAWFKNITCSFLNIYSCIAGIYIFRVVGDNLDFRVLHFSRLTMMRDQKTGLWRLLWR